MQHRIDGLRDPHLRSRVPKDRIRTVWAGRIGGASLARQLAEFGAYLKSTGPLTMRRPAKPSPQKETLDA
jgi:hypothetical protein